MTEVRDYYEKYWSSDGFAPVGYGTDWKLRELFEQVVTAESRSLEIGCGDGSKNGSWLTNNARSYVGVDVSSVAVELARERGLDARVIADAGEQPFADAGFDLVVVTEVFEHLFDPLGAAREAARVLRPGGDLVVTTPNIAHWRNRADMALLGRWHPGGDGRSVQEPWRDPHVRFFTPRTLRAFLVAAGFTPVSVGGYVPSGSIIDRVPGLRRLARPGDEPRPWARALVEAAPSLLGQSVYAHARASRGR